MKIENTHAITYIFVHVDDGCIVTFPRCLVKTLIHYIFDLCMVVGTKLKHILQSIEHEESLQYMLKVSVSHYKNMPMQYINTFSEAKKKKKKYIENNSIF